MTENSYECRPTEKSETYLNMFFAVRMVGWLVGDFTGVFSGMNFVDDSVEHHGVIKSGYLVCFGAWRFPPWVGDGETVIYVGIPQPKHSYRLGASMGMDMTEDRQRGDSWESQDPETAVMWEASLVPRANLSLSVSLSRCGFHIHFSTLPAFVFLRHHPVLQPGQEPRSYRSKNMS